MQDNELPPYLPEERPIMPTGEPEPPPDEPFDATKPEKQGRTVLPFTQLASDYKKGSSAEMAATALGPRPTELPHGSTPDPLDTPINIQMPENKPDTIFPDSGQPARSVTGQIKHLASTPKDAGDSTWYNKILEVIRVRRRSKSGTIQNKLPEPPVNPDEDTQ